VYELMVGDGVDVVYADLIQHGRKRLELLVRARQALEGLGGFLGARGQDNGGDHRRKD